MILFFLLLFGVFTLSGAIFFWTEIGITNDRLRWLEERLTKLEKDAVKITFTPKEQITTTIKSNESPVKTKKRKPKSVKDWEDNFDLGGHE
jgi:hypothetical protein